MCQLVFSFFVLEMPLFFCHNVKVFLLLLGNNVVMKITKTASGSTIIRMSRCEWERIGRKAGWFSTLCSACNNILFPPEHIPDTPDDQHVESHGLCPRCIQNLYEKYLVGAKYTKEKFNQEIMEQEQRILNAWKKANKTPPIDLFVNSYPEISQNTANIA